MKKPCLALGAAIGLAAQFSAVHAIDFKRAVVGQPIADRTLTIGKLSMQLPSGQWILVSKTSGIVGVQNNQSAPPLQTFAAVQVYNKTVSAIVIFAAPAWSYVTNRWGSDPCKEITSFIHKSTLNQTTDMPECFAVTTQAASSFQVSTDSTFQNLARWAYDGGYALPDPVVRVFYTKYHHGDFFRLNAYFTGGSGSPLAAEAWGRDAVSSLSAMITRSTAQGTLPELHAFVAAPASATPLATGVQPVAGSANAALTSAEARLRQLQSLLDSKLITREEYEGKRKKIVDEM